MADDPSTHRLFLLRVITNPPPPLNNTTVQLVTVDMTHTPAAVTAVSLIQPLQPLAELAFDTSSGTLYGLTAGPNTLPITIVQVAPSTGAETTRCDRHRRRLLVHGY